MYNSQALSLIRCLSSDALPKVKRPSDVNLTGSDIARDSSKDMFGAGKATPLQRLGNCKVDPLQTGGLELMCDILLIG